MNTDFRNTFLNKNAYGLHEFTKASAYLIALIICILPSFAKATPADMQAMFDLVPLTRVDRTVVQSGRWSQASTWSGGQLPQDGENIHVPLGKKLIVNVIDDTRINTLRVDGILKFPSRRNTKIVVDTLVVTDSGKFIVGTKKNPIKPSNKVEIIIPNNGPIDRTWDPENMSRGIILHGKTRIFGSHKTAYHPLATYPTAGGTQFTLAEDPEGWKNGDTIVITATKFHGKKPGDVGYVTYDEVRTISSINGRDISLGDVNDATIPGPLNYDHTPIFPGMPVYASNMTRNVVFRGEGGDQIPTSERGHFMIMHNADAIVKGAGFYHLGRTDKSKPIDDFVLDANGNRVKDSSGKYIPGAKNNPRGRYSMHFHHTGLDITQKPAICSGNAVISSPGWGFVIHGSQVEMTNNASLDVFGSHFVTEDGNEIGVIKNNIAIRAQGWKKIEKARTANHDLGHSGHGFWLESRNLKVESNVVSGAFRAGLVYFHRHDTKITGVDLDIPEENLLTKHKLIVKGRSYIHYDDVPISHQKDLIVVASGRLLTVIKANGDQGHNVRNMIESLEGYAVKDGIDIAYTQKYTIKDVILYADPSSGKWDDGILIDTSTRDVAIVNAEVNGYHHPVLTSTDFNGKPDLADALFVNVNVNGQPLDPNKDMHKLEELPNYISSYDPNKHTILDTVDLVPGQLDFAFNPSMSFDLPPTLQWNTGFVVKGTFVDSAGPKPYYSKWKGNTMLVDIIGKGYYTRPDGSRFVIVSDVVTDRVTGNTIPLEVEANIVTNYGSLLGPSLGAAP